MGFADLLASGDVSVRGILGQTVTYAPGTGDPVEVSGVFDAAYLRVNVGEPGISSSSPAVFLSLSDLPSGAEDDSDAVVTVASVDYIIHEILPDGEGAVVLLLHKA